MEKKLWFFVGVLIILIMFSGIVYSDEIKVKEVKDKELLIKAEQFPDEMQRVIITFSKKPEGYRNFITSLGGRVTHDYDIIEGIAITLPGRSIKRLRELKNIISIQEDRKVHAFLSESIPLINADDVWVLGYDGSGKTICIVDTGVDDSHPALNPLVAEKCYCSAIPPGPSKRDPCCPNGQEEDNNAMDDDGHGTHCAGIIASQDSTYKGVAPGASLMAVKVLDSSGSGLMSDVIAGIDWCSAQNADVISISLGGGQFFSYCDGEADALAVNNAVDAGAVVSVASGNDGWTNAISAPACASKAISVGATTKSDQFASYTNRNEILDLLAPGGTLSGSGSCPTNNYVCSAQLGGGFIGYSGTSMSTPHVSGAVALLLEAKPSLSPAQVEFTLENTGVDIYDSGSGLTFPRIDTLAAVTLPPLGYLEPYIINIPSEVTKDEFFTAQTGVQCIGGSCGDVSTTLKLYFESNPTTCSEIWGFDCGANPDNDNTFDNCDNTAGEDEHIEEIYLDKNKVGFGEEVEVKCEVMIDSIMANPSYGCGWGYTGDNLYIYYRNSPTGTWQKKHYVSQVYSCDKYSIKFVPDNVEGEHQVRCITGYQLSESECGSGSAYDNDDANFSVVKDIIPTTEDTPFYTTSDNPQTCPNMQDQDTCEQTWQVKATGEINTIWEFFTIYDSDYEVIETKETAKISVTIVGGGEFISITFEGPIDFGNLDPSTSNNPASGNPYSIIINPETTIDVDIYQKGDDYAKGTDEISIDNMKWNEINSPGDSITSTYSLIMENIGIGNYDIYYWLDIPLSQYAGNYDTTIYIKAVETKKLEVHYINVSQGDAEFIISPDGYTLLIDSGRYDSNGDDVVAYIQSLGYNKIDYVMASHLHADHLGGLDIVVNALNPDVCYDHGGTYSSTQYNQYDSACSGKRQTLSQGNYINLGASVTAEILQAGYSSDENTKSIVMELTYNNLDLIFGGDCTNTCEATLSPGDLEVYKVHHHGSKTSSTQSFLDIILPEVSIIEVGTNSYGHPTPETLGRLTAIGSNIFRTDQDGTVILTSSDGTNYNVAGNNYVAS